MKKHTLYKSVLSIMLASLLLIGVLPTLAQSSSEVELVGTISAITPTTVTVNQQEVIIVGAQINTPLALGELVKIEGLLGADGIITVREVNAPNNGVQEDEFEIVGILESFDGSIMVVSGLSIDVTGAELKDGILIGELVKIHLSISDDNTWQAREAEAIVADDVSLDDSIDNSTDDNSTDDNSQTNLQDGEFEIVGSLDEIGDGYIVISGLTINISDAEINDLLTQGVQVKVHVQNINGELLAREVENEIADDNSDDSTDDNSVDDNSDDSTANTAVSQEDASATVLGIYPNTTITEIELDDFGDNLVWKIKTSHGIELIIDAQSGLILTIERNNNNSDDNSVDSNDDHGNDGNINSNDDHANDDNNDDHGGNSGKDSNDDNDDHDDNSGMGSDDD